MAKRPAQHRHHTNRIVLALLDGGRMPPADYLTGKGDPEGVDAADISANFFATLGGLRKRDWLTQEGDSDTVNGGIGAYAERQRRPRPTP